MRFQIFQRRTLRGKQWFWRLRARNGRIIGVSGEGFYNRADVESIVDKIKAGAATAFVEQPPR